MAVRPMAGVVRIAPAITPFSTNCAMSISTPGSGDLDELERSVVHAVEAELAVQDVADIGESAWSAGAGVFDVLASLQCRQPIYRRVDDHAVAVGDLAYIVA